MAPAVPPDPTKGSAPAIAEGGLRLALTSFLLSLAAPVWLVLLVTRASVRLLAPLGTRAPLILAVALHLGSLTASIGAIVIGARALRRTRRSSPQQARRGWAVAGLLLGIVGAVLLVLIGAGFILIAIACSGPVGCFGGY